MSTQFLQASENSIYFLDMDWEAKRYIHRKSYRRPITKEMLFLHESEHWQSTLT